jgi:glycine cleavage system protein P-like pyridoxal-binding family
MSEASHIDIHGNYSVKFANGMTRVLTGQCLLHNYLRNKLNKSAVITFERIEGKWHDIFIDGRKWPGIYATSEQDAIKKHVEDRLDMDVDPSTVTARLSPVIDEYLPINL